MSSSERKLVIVHTPAQAAARFGVTASGPLNWYAAKPPMARRGDPGFRGATAATAGTDLGVAS